MNWLPKWVREHAKTIGAFVATFVGNMIVSFIDGTTPFPQTRDEWTQYLLTSAGAAFATYVARNKITQKQLDKDPNVLGGIVVDTPPAEAPAPPPPAGGVAGSAGAYVNPFPDPTGL